MPEKRQKTCLITGANGGIGRALVQVFHEAGYAVVATDLAEKPSTSCCGHYHSADLARIVEDEAYARQIVEDFRAVLEDGCLDVLINNAAIQILGGADSLLRADWQATLNVNVIAPFLLAQAFLPELEAAGSDGGGIINIGSIHARMTKKNFVAYATSKSALAGMTRALAVDLGARVRVNAIEPAAIETEMLKAGFAGKPDLYAGLKKCHPQQRIGRPEEVARLALAIAEGGMGFLHGACIGVDGGIAARLFDPD